MHCLVSCVTGRRALEKIPLSSRYVCLRFVAPLALVGIRFQDGVGESKSIYRLLATALMCSCMLTLHGRTSFAADQRLPCLFAQIFYLESSFLLFTRTYAAYNKDLFMKAKSLSESLKGDFNNVIQTIENSPEDLSLNAKHSNHVKR